VDAGSRDGGRPPRGRLGRVARLAANEQVLVVSPDFTTGLAHAELDRVEAWLAEPPGES